MIEYDEASKEKAKLLREVELPEAVVCTEGDTDNGSSTTLTVKTSYLLYVLMAFALFILYYMTSITVMINYRNSLFKRNDYWQRAQMAKSDPGAECAVTSSSLERRHLDDLKSFVRYVNKQKQLNYFLCFSSLYYTVKLEKYDSFRAGINDSSFETVNEFYREKSRDKCVQAERSNYFDLITDFGSLESLDSAVSAEQPVLHLCVLKSRPFSMCKMVESYKRMSPLVRAPIRCQYKFWNGEYEVRLNPSVKLTMHEYEASYKDNRDVWRLSPGFYGNIDEEKSFDYNNGIVDEKAKLNLGLSGFLFGSHYFFNLPLSFFYNEANSAAQNFNYINYLNAAFRVPSEIVNYFMIFYPKIWYL